jgi:hypothetical protein
VALGGGGAAVRLGDLAQARPAQGPVTCGGLAPRPTLQAWETQSRASRRRSTGGHSRSPQQGKGEWVSHAWSAALKRA